MESEISTLKRSLYVLQDKSSKLEKELTEATTVNDKVLLVLYCMIVVLYLCVITFVFAAH